jgi:hypothetical protein
VRGTLDGLLRLRIDVLPLIVSQTASLFLEVGGEATKGNESVKMFHGIMRLLLFIGRPARIFGLVVLYYMGRGRKKFMMVHHLPTMRFDELLTMTNTSLLNEHISSFRWVENSFIRRAQLISSPCLDALGGSISPILAQLSDAISFTCHKRCMMPKVACLVAITLNLYHISSLSICLCSSF